MSLASFSKTRLYVAMKCQIYLVLSKQYARKLCEMVGSDARVSISLPVKVRFSLWMSISYHSE